MWQRTEGISTEEANVAELSVLWSPAIPDCPVIQSKSMICAVSDELHNMIDVDT